MLENHPDMSSFSPEFRGGKFGHILSIDDYLPGGRSFQHVYASDKCRLSGAGLPDDAEDFPIFNGEVDILKGIDTGCIGFRYMF